MLNAADANALVSDMVKEAGPEWARLRRYSRYARGRQPMPWLPEGVDSEYRDIAKKSASNWLDLVIRATGQGLQVDSYGDTSEGSEVWEKAWQANGMDARQHALHRAVGTLGYGYLIVFPIDGEDDTEVWMRPESADKMWARYDEPGDEWPTSAIRVVNDDKKKGRGRWELYDGDARYVLTGKLGSAEVAFTPHELGDAPVVQMRWAFDLLGTPQGEVEPVMSIQDRIVDATFTLQMVAKYGAFPQRWIAGLNPGEPLRDAQGAPLLDANGQPIMPTIKAYIDHILMAADPETKFGQFAAADLKQYVEALEAHIRHLAAITQTPPHYLLGSLVNLSAEALAAAESGLMRKIREKREVLGEGYEQAMRLAAEILGDEEAAQDMTSQVHWQDVESRSLSQVADSILKLNEIVPRRQLLEMIPGWTKTDVDAAMDALAEQPASGMDALAAQLASGQTSPDDPATIKAKSDAMGVMIRAGVEPERAAELAGLVGVTFTGAVPVSLRVPASDASKLES